MKKMSLIFGFVLVVIMFSFSQSPQAFKYQAVARNNTGDLIINQLISVRISILQGTPGGSLVYREVHNVATNEFGLFSLEIGNPSAIITGIFENIEWGIDAYFLQIEIDPNGGSTYIDMGTSQMVSVPYALFSQNSGNSYWGKEFNNVFYDEGAVGIGTPFIAPHALLHMVLPGSGDFDRFQIESPSDNVGFGILFAQPSMEWYVGQNIGNWDDGRFQIVPGVSDKWMTLLSNGNLGLTKAGFTTPLARFQVPQNGNMSAGSSLDVTQAAIYIGENMTTGMAFDRDQIESVNNDLKINFQTSTNISLANGGGQVGIGVEIPKAPFHVGEGNTVLFGADTLGKTNFYPDPKLMFLPAKGGAFRVGQLNADGSLTTGTGYNFWDPSNVGWASIAIGNNTRASGAGSVALGIRANAINFGSVALGHLSRTKGNSAVSAGYYTRADAFVSMAVGAGNVGGGSSDSWINTDPIFEVGNSIDTNNRSNAFTVMKNGRVGINHSNPQSMLDIEQPNSGVGNGVLLNLQGYGHWETGVDYASDYNLYYNNVLKAYILDTDGSYINTSDGNLKQNIQRIGPVLANVLQLKPSTYQFVNNPPGSSLSTGFIAQEVENLFPEQVVEKDGIKGIKYSEFSIIAIKAIQEQQEIIDSQQKQIDDLEERIAKLEKDFNR
ncbi:MAG: tail fiber domain-containing protein [Bacteroidetes bacterium]|nr:tail fiber domain-containing protein [Bacteroidota bacterium]